MTILGQIVTKVELSISVQIHLKVYRWSIVYKLSRLWQSPRQDVFSIKLEIKETTKSYILASYLD